MSQFPDQEVINFSGKNNAKVLTLDQDVKRAAFQERNGKDVRYGSVESNVANGNDPYWLLKNGIVRNIPDLELLGTGAKIYFAHTDSNGGTVQIDIWR